MILPTSYFPSIFQMALQAKTDLITIEAKEHFIKQSFRNRCEIYSANGKLGLVVPIKKWKNHTPIEEIKISSEDNWQNIHWKSITSAYRTSPFFEFYEDEVKPLFFLNEDKLIIRNTLILKELNAILGIKQSIEFSKDYEVFEKDYRILIHPKMTIPTTQNFPTYLQVFGDKGGFIPNLSILDLLFNLGPESKTYLNNLEISN
jgi:hypothetical protein